MIQTQVKETLILAGTTGEGFMEAEAFKRDLEGGWFGRKAFQIEAEWEQSTGIGHHENQMSL